MSQFGWDSCPDDVRAQAQGVVRAIQGILADNLVGIYLHGSLAFGCFNSARSDLDLLVVTAAAMSVDSKRAIVEKLLASSGQPCPVEISFLSRDDLHPWRYPPPFDLHFSEDWRVRYERALEDGTWRQWNAARQVDLDLGAHVAVTMSRGICLVGGAISVVFPSEAIHAYRAAIMSDCADWPSHIGANPEYYILNACRIAAYLADGAIRSKAEGGMWGLAHLPLEWHSLIGAALVVYQGEAVGKFHEAEEQGFAEYMMAMIDAR